MSWRISVWSSLLIACLRSKRVRWRRSWLAWHAKVWGLTGTLSNLTSPDRMISNHSRIGTPGVNEGVFSPSRKTTSSFAKWTGNIEPSDTSVHVSATQERNLDLTCIEKVGVKSVLGESVPDLEPSKRVNLANSVRHSQIFSNKKLWDSVIRVMQEEEEEIESHINNIKMDTSCHSHVATDAEKKDANMSLERRLASGVLAETIKFFKGYNIPSTINDSGCYE